MTNAEFDIIMRSNASYVTNWMDDEVETDCGYDRIVKDNSVRGFFRKLFRR